MPTPTFVQGVMTNGARTSAVSVLHLNLPNKALAGNCLILAVAWGTNSGTPSLAISDDQGNTWTAGPTEFDSANSYNLSTWYALNVAAGTRQVTVTASGGDLLYVMAQCSEFYNVATSAASDATPAHAHGSSSTWSPGSMTTATDGDLIVSWAIDAGGNWPYGNFTPGASFALCNADRLTGFVAQYRVQTTHGAITASATASKAAPFLACAIALKSASAGTAPTADPRILRVTWVDAVGSSFVQQAPSDGNIRAVGWVGVDSTGATRSMTGITETGGATYTRTTGVGNGQSGLAQWGYATGASASATNAITITSGTDNRSTAVVYDILATGATFDKSADATGLQADSADLTTVSLTPTNATGIVLCALGINSGAIRDLVGSDYEADNPWTAEEDGGANVLHQDNGWGHTFNASTSVVTFTWTNSNSGVGDGVQDWAAQAIAFSAAGGGGTTLLPGVGALTATGFAPTITQSNNKTVAAGVGALTITGFAPTVSLGTVLTPGVGTLTATGFAPSAVSTANHAVTPGVGVVTVTGFAPLVSVGNVAAPGVGVLSATGFAPTITRSSNQVITPGVGVLAYTGFAPTVFASDSKVVLPGVGLLGVQGFAPVVVASAPIVATATRIRFLNLPSPRAVFQTRSSRAVFVDPPTSEE